LIFKLAENEEAPYVAAYLIYNFDKLSEKARGLLCKLVDYELPRRVIVNRLDDLPESVRNELLTRINKEK
jgi:hypothetical protein